MPKSSRAKSKIAAAPRRGRTRASLPPDHLRRLNRGEVEARTLVEWLAMDFGELLTHAVPELAARADELRPGGIMDRTRAGGRLLFETFGRDAIVRFGRHRSDVVRQWAGTVVGLLPDRSLSQRLELIRPFADDSHMGVREIAWMTLRPHLAVELATGLKLLAHWSHESSPNLRRFASEVSRPRGVWCAHLSTLKDQPELGRNILEPLKSDPARYVQNSVANWLNDAGKTQRPWVQALCDTWRKQSATPETNYIIRRACRNF